MLLALCALQCLLAWVIVANMAALKAPVLAVLVLLVLASRLVWPWASYRSPVPTADCGLGDPAGDRSASCGSLAASGEPSADMPPGAGIAVSRFSLAMGVRRTGFSSWISVK